MKIMLLDALVDLKMYKYHPPAVPDIKNTKAIPKLRPTPSNKVFLNSSIGHRSILQAK